MIRKYFGNGDKWGVSIQYVHEEEPLGTAGALGLLPKDIQNVPILMMNGDLLTKINFERLLAFHNQHDGVATMGVREYDFQVPYGVIKAEDYKVKSIVEKPVHKFFINAGIYVLDSSLIKQVSADNYLDMPFFLEEQIDNGSTVNMFPIHEYWLDIGQIDEYERAKNEVHNIFP
jgi:NDP-sugar pyrophosphorylase family protein